MVEFVVESIDINGADDLANTIEAAAKEGSIIANIQKEASSNGVLTKKLSEMARKLSSVATAVEATTKEIRDVQVPAPTPAPTKSPTKSSTKTPTKSPTAPTQSPTQSPTTPAPASPTPAPVDDPAADFSAGTPVAPAFGTVMAIFALSMVWTGL